MDINLLSWMGLYPITTRASYVLILKKEMKREKKNEQALQVSWTLL